MEQSTGSGNQKSRQANITEEEKERRRLAKNEYLRKRRSNFTEEEREKEREYQKRYRQLKKPQSEAQMQQTKTRCKRWRDRQSEEYKRGEVLRLQQWNPVQESLGQQEPGRLRHVEKHVGRDTSLRPNLHDLGNQDKVCKFCSALHFESERTTRGIFGTCCSGGSIALPLLHLYPEQFRCWLERNTDEGKHVVQNIRKYNSAFAFASFGCQPVKFSGGPPAFVIHGQVYHTAINAITKSTSAPANSSETYAQLYFLDPEFANLKRIQNSHNVGIKNCICETIDNIIRQINPFAAAFQMMKNKIATHQNSGKSIQMWLTRDRQHDPRRYNLPTANEVAAIFVTEDGNPPFNRDIAIHPIGEKNLQQIQIISPNCDPMTYPLLFPYGEAGWQPNIEKIIREENNAVYRRKNVSMREFYSYRLQERNQFNPLLHAGKLTQQFQIDAFMKVEGHRLDFNRQNQKQLRVDLYLGLMDFVNTKAEEQGLKPGRVVILPSSFQGGKRALQQNYQDAMTIVAKFGKPDLFITFTCNPKWPEIQNNLKYGETAIDRGDLTSAVFQLKLKEFLHDLTGPKGIFGKCKAFVYTIEFQKRGLPHCHLLLILADEDKVRTAEDVDSIVSAEIPNQVEDPELFEIVTSTLIHGPCGDFNKKAPCMDDVKGVHMCTKNFPKDFCDETNVNVNGYPVYRRREDNAAVVVRGNSIDNRWVVPYNPYLARKYNAHINVEVCFSVQSIKYIFKYVYKGHDAAIIQVSENDASGVYHWDEIRTFLDARYIAAPEAMWRLRAFEMHGKSHSIERLPVHLPSQQAVYFEDGNEQESLRQAERKGTKLTKWFLLNQTDPEANQFLYCEIPYHYVWITKSNTWQRRKRGSDKVLPRMYAVSIRDMERFCLRLLLMHIKGAKSFDDLKTVNGVTHPTFHEAAKATGLLDDDREWERTMQEAVVFKMPAELRLLFSTILVNAHPSNSKELYETYKGDLCEDYKLTYGDFMAEQRALNDIQTYLMQFGKSCRDFNLPSPTQYFDTSEQVNYQLEKEESETLKSQMNREQLEAFNAIMGVVHRGEQRCFFLSGAGGCGKTFVYRALISKITGDGGLVKVVAPTGLAATLLKGGKTVHSGFGLPIDLNEDSLTHFTQGSHAWKELLETRLIIWDEISMSHSHLLNSVDKSLRQLLNSDKPFAGIPIVVGGDFMQQAPVVPHGSRIKIIEACVKSSSLWKHFVELKLFENMRVKAGEAEFCQWLLDIGSGKDGEFVALPKDILAEDIVNAVFGGNINALSPAELASRSVLCPKNADTLKINEKILAMLEGSATTYFSVDTISDCETEEERAQYPIEFLNSLTPMGLPPHALQLKKGCCVMLLRNLNAKYGLCNGTRLIVESLGSNLLECSIFSGQRKGKKVFIPRVPLDSSSGSDLPFKLRRKQFPLRLAYSMTITKSQGQTFDKIGLYLPETVFSHGQLYTALSRVRTKEGLSIQINECRSQGKIFENSEETYTYNCVFDQILH